jgi:predicted protein tyrosine phosphatase
MTTLPQARYANLSFVTPQLAVGGDLDAGDRTHGLIQLMELVQLGVTHVVDVRSEWSDAELLLHHAPELRYLHHGMDDAGQRVDAEWFEVAVSWLEAAWAQDPDAVVLSHCHMGINRGPSLGFAILLAQGWDPVDGHRGHPRRSTAGQRLVRRRRAHLAPRTHRRRRARRGGAACGARRLARSAPAGRRTPHPPDQAGRAQPALAGFRTPRLCRGSCAHC